MSLKTFHIVFITISTILAFAFGIWCLKNGLALFGATSFLTGGILIVYGSWFLRKLRDWDADAAKRKTVRDLSGNPPRRDDSRT
jgi:hypothetical protein